MRTLPPATDNPARLLPHPLYAPLHWVCVVNPGERTRPELAALLGRAHELARRQYGNRRGRHR